MKQLFTKSMGFALGLALVAPLLMAPAAVNGSLSGFSSNAQGGQNADSWGIPGDTAQSSSNQNASSGGEQRGAGDGHPTPEGAQRGAGEGQPKAPDGSNQNGSNQNSTGGQQGDAGDGQPKGLDGNGQSGPAEGQGSADCDGPTKNNSNTGDGDGGQSGQGPHADDGPTKNNSNNDGGDGSSGGNGSSSSSSSSSSTSSSSSSSSSSGGGPSGGEFPPLDPAGDGPYDPSNNDGGQQVPSGCAEAGSACAQCVQRAENAVQFNRNYLHVAWSTTHQTLEYTNRAIAFGDAASGIHSTQALAWQLAGKPQITEAVASLRKTYDTKYRIYIRNLEQALESMSQCEQENFAVRDLYQRFSSLYLEFVKARYQSPD